MKNLLLFLLPLSFLVGLSSCSVSMEKRVYRNGWYAAKPGKPECAEIKSTAATSLVQADKSMPRVAPAIEELQIESGGISSTESQISMPENCRVGKTDNTVAVASNIDFVNVKTPPTDHPIKQIIYKLRGKYTHGLNDPNRVTYTQARKQMADKGCTPNSTAMVTYYMAWASVASIWFGFGLLLCVATLIISLFATESVIKEGSCVDENLAIIAAARRICFIELIWFAIITVLAMLLVLGIIAILGYYGQL